MMRLDAWLSTAATVGLWICLGWLLVGFTVALLAEAPGAVGRSCSHLAERISPRIIRRLAGGVIGLVFAIVSVAGAGTATGATTASEGSGWPSQPAHPGHTALSRLPSLDRPALALGWPGGTSEPQPTLLPRLPTAMPHSPTTLPRLPTAPAQPSAASQPGSAHPASIQPGSGRPDSGRPDSGQRNDSDSGSPDERPARDRTMIVVPGDTLWDIAARELGGEPSNREIAVRWPRWYATNRSVIGPDPDLILPGQRLLPPT